MRLVVVLHFQRSPFSCEDKQSTTVELLFLHINIDSFGTAFVTETRRIIAKMKEESQKVRALTSPKRVGVMIRERLNLQCLQLDRLVLDLLCDNSIQSSAEA